jgi:RNA polymerase sigma factor (sigma-70 family)
VPIAAAMTDRRATRPPQGHCSIRALRRGFQSRASQEARRFYRAPGCHGGNFRVDRNEQNPPRGEGAGTGSEGECMMCEARVAELSDSHGPQLLAYLARMLGRIEVAHEVAEDTYKEIRRLYRAEDLMFPRSTLFKIGTHLALMRLRAGRSEASLLATSAAMGWPHNATSPDKRAGAEEVNEKLVQTIKGLRPSLRMVLVMAHVQGIPRNDIAQQLGISLKRVDKRMTKALRTLCQRMECRDINEAGTSALPEVTPSIARWFRRKWSKSQTR